MNLPPAIVTDALWRKSVAAIRALGRSGYSVTALGASALTTGFYSRFTTRRLTGPTAADSTDGFGRLLQRAVTAAAPHGRPVILPMEDESCSWLLHHGAALQPAADWLLPPAAAFAIANDKAATMRLAAELGIPCPLTFAPSSPEQLHEILRSQPATPWLAKPAISKGAAGILYERELTPAAVAATWAAHGPLVLQERIPASGQASGVSLLYDRASRCRAVFCHRRLRQYPLSGGASTSRISVAPAAMPDLVAHSRRLLEHLGWRGVAMVEWKQDPRTGEHRLLEINPRFWGSLELAIRAGVDFPTLYARAASGDSLPDASPAYRQDVVCRWLMPGELLRYAGETTANREPLREFFRGSLRTGEEFARDDWRGSVASIVCPALLALNPRYWRYARRDRHRQKA